MAARRMPKKRTTYQKSRIATRLVKSRVPKALLPLYNHLLRLAEDSHKRGYVKRAGIELRKARGLAEN